MPGDNFVIKAPTVQQPIVVEIKGEDKLVSFSKLLNNIANGSKLHEYWGAQEQMIQRVTNAYGKFVQVANQETGGELIKSMNALKAVAGDEIPNVLSNYGRISKAFEEASANFGHAFSEYTAPNFKEVFASLEDMKAFGLETETVIKRIGSSTNVQQLQQQLEQLRQVCAALRTEIRNLEKERENLLNGTEISRLREIETQFKSLKSTMAGEFSSFLQANDLDSGRWGQFSEYFDKIYNGSMTAKAAITLVRQQLVEMFREGQTVASGDTVFNSTQMQDFITKLDDACAKIEQMRQEMQSLTAGAGLRQIAEQMGESSVYTEQQRDAIKDLVAQGAGLGSVTELLHVLIQNFDTTDEKVRSSVEAFRGLLDVLSQIAHVEPANMSGFNDVLKNIHSLQTLNVDPKQMQTLATSLQMLGDVPSLPNLSMLGSIDLRGFADIKVSKASMSNLAEYLPAISTQVDVGKLQALSQISLANLSKDNLSVSKASFDHLRELIQTIQGVPSTPVSAPNLSGLESAAQAIDQVAVKAKQEKEVFREAEGVLDQHIASEEAAAKAEDDKRKISELLSEALKREEDATKKAGRAAQEASAQESQYVNTTMKRVFDLQRSIEDARVNLGKLNGGTERPEYKTYRDLIMTLEEVIQKYYKFQEVLAANPDNVTAATKVLDIKAVWGQIADVAMQFAEARENVNMFAHQTKDGMTESKTAAKEFLRELDALTKIAGKGQWGVFTEQLKKIERDFKAIQNPSETLRQKMEDLRSILNTLSNSNADPMARIEAYERLQVAIEGVNLSIRNEANAERDAASAQKAIETGAANAANEIKKLDEAFNSLSNKTKFDTSAFEQMRTLLEQVNNTSLSTSDRQSALQQLNDLIKQNAENLRGLATAEKAEATAKKLGDAADKQKATLIRQLNTLLDQCTKAEQRYAIVSKAAFARDSYKGIQETKEHVQQLLRQLDDANPKFEEISAGVRKAQTDFSNFNTTLKTGGGFLNNYLTTGMSQLKSRLTYTFGLAAMVYKTVGEIKKMISTAVELDSAMNTLQIVTRASGDEMEAYARRVSAAAQETAQSTKDLIDATTVYARLGYSMDESAVLSKYTAMLQGVGDIGASDAQNAMTAIIKSFGKNVNEIEDVMDKLVVVGNNFPISVSQLAEGMNNASSMLAVAGNSFEESIALLTAANTTVQNISKASTALRTIAARIRKMTTEDGEIIEESKYDEMIKALTQHNVSLVDANGEYRKTYDVIRDIAKVWKDLSTMQQAAVSEALAGTRQQNVFSSLVTQFQEAENAMDRMADAGGELQAAYDIRMESIEAHVQRMKAAYDQLSMDFVDSGLAKDAVDLLTDIINLLDLLINKIGVLGTVLSAGALPGLFKMISAGTFKASIAQLASTLGLLKSSSTALTVVGTAGASLTGVAPIIMAVVGALSMLHHVLEQINTQREQKLSESYNAAMQHANEQGAVYNLYLTYLDAKEKQDETEESKRRLQKASEDLAVALGYEKSAADSLNDSFQQMSVEQIKAAAADAKNAVRDASDTLLNELLDPSHHTSALFGGKNAKEMAFLERFAHDNNISLTDVSDPLSKQSIEERANTLNTVFKMMQERYRELGSIAADDRTKQQEKEYQQLGDTVKWLQTPVGDLSAALDTLGDMQEHVNDIMRGTTDPAKKLGQALDRLSDNAIQALLSGEYYDEDLEEIQQVMQEYYATPERMEQALKNNSSVILGRVSQPLKNAKEELARIQQEIADQGIDINKTVFGNIDTNNRQVLEWTEDNLRRFQTQLDSFKDENGKGLNPGLGSVSTVLGGAGDYDGLSIAFSPILQTDKGPVLLSQETVNDYIFDLIEELNRTKDKWSTEDLLKLDARGIEKDGRKIKGLIADVGATAKKTSEIMHYLGKDGALSLAERDVRAAQELQNLFAEEIEPAGITSSVEKSVADLSTLRDELKLAIEALEDYKKAMEGGEIDDPIKEAAEIYKGALEDIQSGRKGTNRVKNAAELFLGRDTLNAINWNLEEAERLLQDPMWKFILDPEGTSEFDYGARVAQYIQANFDKATDGVWMQNGDFYYESLDKLAKAFNNSTTAANLFLGALQAHSVNTINSIEENRELISTFKALESQLQSTDEAVRKTVENMYGEGMDDYQIHDTLEQYREAGIIDLGEDELHTIITGVLDHLHEVDKEKVEAEMTLKYDQVNSAIATITNALIDLVTNGGRGWNIEVGVRVNDEVTGNTTVQSGNQSSSGQKGGGQKAAVYTGKVKFPSSAGGKQSGRNGGDTLVNELGPELISDDGRAFIANGGRPGFVRLSANAIVFTADETKDILRGKRNVNGKALAQGNVGRGSLVGRLFRGTVKARAYKVCGNCGATLSATATRCPNCGSFVLITKSDNYGASNAGVNRSAYGSPTASNSQNMGGNGYYYNPSNNKTYYAQPNGNGTSTIITYTTTTESSSVEQAQRAEEYAYIESITQQLKRDTERLKAENALLMTQAERASKSKIDLTSKNASAGSGYAGSGGGNHVGGSDYGSQSDPQKVDWIAVRINRLQRTIADLEKVASSGFKKLDKRLSATKEQIKKTSEEISDMDRAYYRYMAEADSVGLSSDLVHKVREGTIDISEYDDETRKQIDQYTEW